MGTVCRKTSQRKDEVSWHLPLRPSPPLSLRLMPIPTTTEDTVSDTAMVSMVATGHTVSDTAVVSTATARGRLSPSCRRRPCCLSRRPRCPHPCRLQLRPGLPLCLPLHRRHCPRYVANSAGTVHVAKREAEADPYYYGGYGYGGYGLGYRGYGLGYGRSVYWG